LQLGVGEAGSRLPPAFALWRAFAMRFAAALCAHGEAAAGETPSLLAPPPEELVELIDQAPPMQGGEYLRPEVLDALLRSMAQALVVELAETRLSLQDFLKSRDSRWRLVGRVHFNLAENGKTKEAPGAEATVATHRKNAPPGKKAAAVTRKTAGKGPDPVINKTIEKAYGRSSEREKLPPDHAEHVKRRPAGREQRNGLARRRAGLAIESDLWREN
jgi:hypothetical protein